MHYQDKMLASEHDKYIHNNTINIQTVFFARFSAAGWKTGRFRLKTFG